MLYPKYIEFADGGIAIFPNEIEHQAIANRLGVDAVSAGLVSAARHPRGKFFGESLGLSLLANAALDMSQHDWFMAMMRKRPYFATSASMLEQIGATDGAPAERLVVDGIHFLGGKGDRPGKMLDFFLP